MNKKGQIGGAGIGLAISALITLVVGLVLVGLLGTYSAKIQTDIKTDVGSTTTAGQIADLGINNTYDLAEGTKTVSSVGIAAVVISMLLLAFGGFMLFKNQ